MHIAPFIVKSYFGIAFPLRRRQFREFRTPL